MFPFILQSSPNRVHSIFGVDQEARECLIHTQVVLLFIITHVTAVTRRHALVCGSRAGPTTVALGTTWHMLESIGVGHRVLQGTDTPPCCRSCCFSHNNSSSKCKIYESVVTGQALTLGWKNTPYRHTRYIELSRIRVPYSM